MAWWRGQNLDRPITGPDGIVWQFLVWAGNMEGVFSQRIYFWDDAKTIYGFLDLSEDQVIHIRRIKDRLKRLANDSDYRKRFVRSLKFPIERHWPPDIA